MAKKAIPPKELPVCDKNTYTSFDVENFQSGSVILIDKPLEWTSFDVVKYIRNRIKVKKVGHAGTLDPLATGLLILCSGKATKSISMLQGMEKEYIADIRFGASTPSYDAALEPDENAEFGHLTENVIREAIEKDFTGEIMQKPPIFSAIKMKGERLYKKARRGEEVEIAARPVQIYETEILDCNLPDLKIRIRCGKGTYIRSFAHDLGLTLGSRAYLAGLRRTKTGSYTVSDALLPIQFNSKIT